MRTVASAVVRSGFIAALGLLWLAVSPAYASTVDCEAIAARTGMQNGLPRDLMPAISRVETGLKQGDKGVRAWPWTLNVQGKGYYFPTRAAALAKLREVLASGIRNVDVGCMQINYHWHSSNFGSIEEMMSPEANTAYAARFLTELRSRHGSWEAATSHYHSADDERGKAYLSRVSRVITKLPQQQPSFVASTAESRPGMVVQADRSGTDQAIVTSSYGVLALAGNPLVDVAGIGAHYGYANLPESPLPKIRVGQQKRQPRNSMRIAQVSEDRQELIAKLRAEFRY
ncbi:MAG: hypothetical protein R3256_03205 [Thalassovita sp.]|nr:hypothetical protein [Thalassovita sp.]